MRKKSIPITCAILFIAFSAFAQEKFPVIKGYGGIVDVEDAEFSPDTDQEYKLIFDVTLRASDPKNVNAGLDGVARVINLHAYAGVPTEKLDIVVTIRQGATYAILSNDYYTGKFEVDNPNLDLVRQLIEAGVKIYVCGQNLKRANISSEYVLKDVKVALSAFTTTTHYRMQGYAYYKF